MSDSKPGSPNAGRKLLRRGAWLLLCVAGLLLAACGPAGDAAADDKVGSIEIVTPDVQVAKARQTIEAVLEGGALLTPEAATRTPGPGAMPASTDAPAPTAAATLSSAPILTSTMAASATITPSPTVSPAPLPTLDLDATATVLARQMATAVVATLTAAVTPIATPDTLATLESRLATAVAATLTAQPTNTPIPPPTATFTPAAPPTVLPALPATGAAQELQARLGSAGIGSRYPNESYALVGAIGAHINDFRLPNLGITTATMSDALRRGGSASRTNALVNQVWGDWLGDIRRNNLNAYSSDPSAAGLSPFRQLVVRLIQGRQGALVDNQQHGLYNFFTRAEEDHIWYDNVNGVIGAVNRESFLWP
jgi:hypothetical protein